MLVKKLLKFSACQAQLPKLACQGYFSTRANVQESTSQHGIEERDFKPKNILLMRKITRYEWEKKTTKISNDKKLKDYLTRKGSDYDALLKRHDEYHKSLEKIHEVLVKRNLNVQVVKRIDYDSEHVNWADAVFTAGGDGTFLLAASKVGGHQKPVIGINTDPIRSEGVLCLPKKYSGNVDHALERLLTGKFRWMWRHRIRITMTGTMDEPVNLHDQELVYPEHRHIEHVRENEISRQKIDSSNNSFPHQLPVLALNEVFIGESLSARVSFYELSINDSVKVKQKSSGVTVCTGTGSTSWYFNINHVPKQSVREILKIAKELEFADVNLSNKMMIQEITKRFNGSLAFDPSELKMAYSVRDPVPHGLFHVSNPRGFCSKISLRSRMWDAWVVVDGGWSYKFNDGAIVDLEMFDEDALRCVHLMDS